MGTWKQIAALPAARQQAGACWHDGKVYVAGGRSDNSASSVTYVNTLFVYDPTGNTWTTGAVLPAAGIPYLFSTPTDGVHAVYPATGAHYAYDPATNTWATRISAPAVTRNVAHHFVDTSGRFYLAGGGSAVAVHRYDPTLEAWAARADMPSTLASRSPTVGDGMIGSDGKVYLGSAGTSSSMSLIVYDPATDTWTTSATFPDAGNATRLDIARLPTGIVISLPYVRFSGMTTEVRNRIDGYDPGTGTWSLGVVPDSPSGGPYGGQHTFSVAIEPGGRVFLLGGLANDRDGYTYMSGSCYVYKQNDPPTVATLLTMTGGVLVSTAVKNRARHQFNDPNAGDSQSKFDWRYRIVDDPAWITGTETSPNPWHDIPAGIDPGGYERQVLPYDAAGEPAPAWTASGFFTAADPPAGPVITYPINGQLLDQVEYTEWSIPAADAYRVRRVADDGAGTAVVDPVGDDVYFDTGEVVDTLARKIPLNFETNGRTEHVQVQIKLGGLWSPWDSVSGVVSYTRPPTPTYTPYPDEATGSLLLMIATPEPEPGDPAAVSVRVYVDDGAGEERKAVDLPINTSWRYWTPVSGREYLGAIRVESVAANGTTASSV